MDLVYRVLAVLGVLLIIAGLLKFFGIYNGGDGTAVGLIVAGVVVLIVDHLLFLPSRGYYGRRRL